MSIACPTPQKRKFKTQREAIRESISLSRGKGKADPILQMPVRAPLPHDLRTSERETMINITADWSFGLGFGVGVILMAALWIAWLLWWGGTE